MDPSDQALGRQMVRTVGLFQALVALPTLVILGFCAFYQLLDPYYMSFYDFLYVVFHLIIAWRPACLVSLPER